ncbi:alanine--tRNA ligase [Ranunculus cassubicifolius]
MGTRNQGLGVPVERILRMGEDDNFWTSGATGPCGPCTEIYYDFHPERGNLDVDLNDDSRFIEFYNLVFMQYNKMDDGSLEPLKQKHIDTGLGLERMARILQKVYLASSTSPAPLYCSNNSCLRGQMVNVIGGRLCSCCRSRTITRLT